MEIINKMQFKYFHRNSLPSTTSSAAFKTKIEAAQGKLNVDVGFWGGVVPGNQVSIL